MKRFLTVLFSVLSPMAVFAANLVSGEWFIGGDPGRGAGTAFAVAAAPTATASVSVPAVTLNELLPGFHLLGVRMRDSEGEWGHVVWRGFHKQEPEPDGPRRLTGAEWFIDVDPGVGQGTAISMPDAVAGTTTPHIPASELNGLADGFHLLGVRLRDNLSNWGPTIWRGFHIDRTPEIPPNIVSVEYKIFREGSEVFEATAVAMPSGASVTMNVVHGTEGLLLDAEHLLQVVPIDALGRRGHPAYADFTVQNTASLPSVSTASASSVTVDSASTGGSVTASGGASVTERGVVYATTPNPDTATATIVPAGSGLGDFTCHLASLSAGTTYYVRAYAINSEGTAYGAQINFNTQSGGLTVNPASHTVTAAGGSHDFSVTASGTWSWNKSVGSDWVTSGEVVSQNGNQTFSYTVAANTGTSARSATITFTNGSISATHSIFQDGGGTAGERRLLTLDRQVPVDFAATPDKAGVLAFIASPAKNAGKLSSGPAPQTSLVLPGTLVTVTATAKSGHLFEQWSGLPTGSQVSGNTISFIMPGTDLPDLTASFISNPFSGLGSKPVFQGLLRPNSETAASNATVGHLNATLVPSKGSFSGKVLMDGQSTSCSGVLQGDGSVWFRIGKTLAGNLLLKEGVLTGKTLSATWSEDGLQVAVSAFGVEISEGLAQPAIYRNEPGFEVPEDLLNRANGKQGYFTLALPAKVQTPEQDASDYPQGTGYATLTLAKAGGLKLAGVLADGTRITSSSFLVEVDASPVFVQLRTPGGKSSDKEGSLSGELVFDPAAEISDVGGEDWVWFRPVAKTNTTAVQAYRSGWLQGVKLDPVGALYDGSLPAQEALDLDTPEASAGNALLVFSGGKLDAEVEVTNFNIIGNKVVKIPSNHKGFSLSITSKTGVVKGTFTPNWSSPAKKLPAFQGVLLQKGGNAGGWGFFLSNAVGNLDPESGGVTLLPP